MVVQETNRFAHQFIDSHVMRPRSLMLKWTDTNENEMEKFLAILMVMGICPLPKMRLYWSNKPMYRNELIQKTMNRDRFDVLLKCFHFCDNSDPSLNDSRLSKLKPLLDAVCHQFRTTMIPGEEVVVDESMARKTDFPTIYTRKIT
ncbi:hypothetical protein J437_LFUL002052 [Ladona fulva]|uniref:PiggyBac transposable element-derived protein domain-containing protein n=1 Tax=Ladona fulva TaxID=123851 RepID=A0A8K0JVI2_LADFU|nr:hypothetical protein J437_LFUL002052 [Ladona fulva]